MLSLANSIALGHGSSNKGGIQDAIGLLKGIPGLSFQPLTSVGHVWDAFW